MIKIQVNKDLVRAKAGEIVSLDKLDSFWRRRLADAKRDGCCEIVKPTKKKTVKKTSEGVK